MQLTDKIREQGRTLKAKGYEKLFVNKRGEFFDRENAAINSVDNPADYMEITNADLSEPKPKGGRPKKQAPPKDEASKDESPEDEGPAGGDEPSKSENKTEK